MNPIGKRFKALWFADKWNIGYTKQTATQFIESKKLDDISWLNEDAEADYSADPFVVEYNNAIHIYYEFLNFWQGRGKIYHIKNFEFASKQQVEGIGGNHIHLSYPYVFKDEGRLYCIPETADVNEVALYEINTSNNVKLIKKRVLLSGQPFVDTSIIKFNDYYWLFTSIRNNPGKCMIYYAKSLKDEFVPHKLNPITTNHKNYRNAGSLFVVNNVLYRPTQNLEMRYGGSIMINKIATLTPDAFVDEPYFEVLPQEPYIQGIHNISFTDDMIIIDGKKKVFSYIMPVKKIVRKFKLTQ